MLCSCSLLTSVVSSSHPVCQSDQQKYHELNTEFHLNITCCLHRKCGSGCSESGGGPVGRVVERAELVCKVSAPFLFFSCCTLLKLEFSFLAVIGRLNQYNQRGGS